MTQIAFAGNITAPVELRYTQNGKPVGSVTVAVNRKKGDEEATDFYRVTIWDAMAEHAAQLDKGTRVIVLGRQEMRTYQDKEGRDRQSWEVTAYSFGPDLKWATAQVTRAGSNNQGASNSFSPAPQQPYNQPNSDGWAANVQDGAPSFGSETPF